MDTRGEFRGELPVSDDGTIHFPTTAAAPGERASLAASTRSVESSDPAKAKAEWLAFIDATAGRWVGEFERASQPVELGSRHSETQ